MRFDEEVPEAAGVRRRWRREEKEGVAVEEVVKQRKRRHSGRHRKERLSLVPFQPPSTSSPSMHEFQNAIFLIRLYSFSDLKCWLIRGCEFMT